MNSRVSNPAPARARRTDWLGLAGGAILAAGIAAVYGRTFSVPLLFDDHDWLTDNPTLRQLGAQVFSPRVDSNVGGRPLLNLSYALNYAAGGTNLSGYHLVNLIIHVLAAWTLFAVVRRTLRRPLLAKAFASAADALALAISAVWAWHPVQTESVTYLAQRAESLMGLCYLLTLYCVIRGAEAAEPGGRRAWFSLSCLACLAGVATKEVMVTAPLLVFVYDRTFLSGSFAGAWRRNWPVHLALAATWIPLGCLMTGLSSRGAGFAPDIVTWAYGLAECRVVVKYLLLALWPRPLVFDYGPYAAPRLAEVWPYAVVLASLLAASIFAVRRSPAAGFAACWFFLILAPTSSFVPLFTQPMAENRLYLPLAGVASLSVLGVYALAGRRSLPAFAVIAAALGLAAAARNRDYRSDQAIWSDTVAKNPSNARAHNNLANAWWRMPGRLDDAIAECQAALRLDPNFADAHDNLGYVLQREGRMQEALAQYQAAARVKPDFALAHAHLAGILYGEPGRMDDAISEYQEALRLRPNTPDVHNNLANAFFATPGRMNDAVAEYREALRLRPDYAEAHNNLGNAWYSTPGRMDDAIAEYKEALRFKPDYADANLSLALALLSLPGRGAEARPALEEVLRLRPGDQQARRILASLPPPRP